MAGTIVSDVLQDGAGNSTATTNAIQGSAKAWVYFSCPSTTVTINGSYNCSSVTRNSTGTYTMAFTNALASANYAFAGSASRSSATTSMSFVGPSTSTTYTASNLQFLTTNDGGALEDAARCSVIVHI